LGAARAGEDMTENSGRGLRIFLQYWILFAALAGFNFYKYFKSGSRLSLVVAILCLAIFLGWVIFYTFYVRKEK
jgi:hypothetical protein